MNPKVGDFSAILEKIQYTLAQAFAQGADVVVFSELFLTGYPPKDLLLTATFQHQLAQALDTVKAISQAYPGLGILLGTPYPGEPGQKGYNAAVLIMDGQLVFKQHKTLLPVYDIFDEPRYFKAANHSDIFSFKGISLGICICEDAWAHLYEGEDPIKSLVAQGAQLIINLTASPFEAGKAELRLKVFSGHAKTHRVPVVMVNQVGGQDDLIFDGGSFILNAQGEVVFQAPFFEEAIQTYHLSDSKTPPALPVEPIGIEAIYRALVLGLKDYVHKTGFQRVVLGLSGGIDSAVVACLAVEALGKTCVHGVLMPSHISSQDSVADASALAMRLGIQTTVLPVAPLFDTAVHTLSPLGAQAYTYGLMEQNIQARLRGLCLMAYSNHNQALLLATGNKSELAVGYSTLYGDMNGALLPIGDIYKTQVYELARLINQKHDWIPQNSLTKPPSAELAPDQKDQDTLPPYDVLDAILYQLVDHAGVSQSLPQFDPKIVTWVQRALKQAEYKRRQAPIVLKVSQKAFGSGRRFPVAAA